MKKVFFIVMAAALLAGFAPNADTVQAVSKKNFLSIGKPEYARLSIVNGRLVGNVSCEYKLTQSGNKTKTADVDNYEIEYSTSSNFANKTKLEKTALGLFASDGMLKPGKTYYIRARGYVECDDPETGETSIKYSRWAKMKIAYPKQTASPLINSYKFKVKFRKKGKMDISWDQNSFPPAKNVYYAFQIDDGSISVDFAPYKSEMKKRVMLCKHRFLEKGKTYKVIPYVMYGKKFVFVSDDSIGNIYMMAKGKKVKLK